MELVRALGALAEPPGPTHRRLAEALELPGVAQAAEHTDLFGFQLYPYASVYLGAEGMLGGEARDRVAGFWRALHLTPPAEPDHLAVLLALYATLAEAEASEEEPAQRLLRRASRKALLWEHLLSWLPGYLDKVNEIAPPFYRAWGRLLQKVLLVEAASLGPPEASPLHFREAPALGRPMDEGSDPFVDSLLAPVRAGMILVRSDLVRAARELGLGLRLGERRFVLRALLSQDGPGTLEWLAGQARASAKLHRRLPRALARTSAFWAGRADRTATLLFELATEARAASSVA
jgi:TorA maturation chaperone TorD